MKRSIKVNKHELTRIVEAVVSHYSGREPRDNMTGGSWESITLDGEVDLFDGLINSAECYADDTSMSDSEWDNIIKYLEENQDQFIVPILLKCGYDETVGDPYDETIEVEDRSSVQCGLDTIKSMPTSNKEFIKIMLDSYKELFDKIESLCTEDPEVTIFDDRDDYEDDRRDYERDMGYDD